MSRHAQLSGTCMQGGHGRRRSCALRAGTTCTNSGEAHTKRMQPWDNGSHMWTHGGGPVHASLPATFVTSGATMHPTMMCALNPAAGTCC